MKKIQRWDRFLTITVIIVVAGALCILASWGYHELVKGK